MGDEHAFTVETKLTRGTSTDDRDTVKASVSADSLDELDTRLSDLRDRLEHHVESLRSIQPDSQTGRRVADDQSELGEVSP
jgi:hypothetical protein